MEDYIFLGPVWRVKGNASFLVLAGVAEDVDTLQAAAISDRQAAAGLRALEPFPNFAEDEADCPSNCESVGIEIFNAFDPPVALGPKGHAVSHGSSAIDHSGPETLRTVEDPFGQSQSDLREAALLI